MPPLNPVGLIGIIIAIALFVYFVYKGHSPFVVAAVCALIVVVTNLHSGVPFLQQLAAPFSTVTDEFGNETTGSFITGLWDMIKALFPMIFLGVIFGKVYSATGAAESLARTLINKFVIKREGKAKVTAAVLVMFVLFGVCNMGGMDCYVLMFTVTPICLITCEMANIPRRFLPAMLCLGTAFIAAPGAPQIFNVIAVAAMKSQIPVAAEAGAMQIVGQLAEVGPLSGWLPGLASTIIIAVLCITTLIRMINKATDKGELFDFGPLDKVEIPDRKLPHFIVTLLPLACVFVVYTVLNQPVFIALLAGIILALATMGRNLPKVNLKNEAIGVFSRVTGVLNDGAAGYPNALIAVSSPNALAGVVTSTAVFGAIVARFAGMHIDPILLTIIFVCVVVAITSSPPTGLFVSLSVVVPVAIGGAIAAVGGNAIAATLPVSAHAITRVAAIAASTFETMPANGMIIVALSLAKCSHKESYKPMFMMTVAYTLLGTIVAALLCLIPGIA